MMKTFPEKYSATVSVLFRDMNGANVQPDQVKAKLYDGAGTLLVDFGILPVDPFSQGKDVTIPAAFNTLGAGKFEDMRVLRVEMVTASGIIPQVHKYLVVGERKLTILENSFVTLEEAQVLSRHLSAARILSAADEEQQFNALIEAFERIVSIPMKYTLDESPSRYDTIAETSRRIVELPRDIWETIDMADFGKLPEAFRKALRTAQLIEANEILSGDDISRRHRAGIISETVGESSIMLRGGAVDFGVSNAALRALAGYINYSAKVFR